MAIDRGSIDRINSGKSFVEGEEKERMAKAVEVEKRTVTPLAESKAPQDIISNLLIGLPGRIEAEERIQSRPDAMEELRKELDFKPENLNTVEKLLKTGTTILKGAAVADERIQSTLFGPLYEMEDIARNPKETLKDASRAIFDGLTGSRKVRLSDVIQSRVPEISLGGKDISKDLSAIAGFGGELVVGTGIVKGANAIMKSGLKTAESVGKVVKLSEEILNASGRGIERLFKSSVGNKRVNPAALDRIVDLLPEGVMDDIFNNEKLFGVTQKIIKKSKEKVVGLSGKVEKTFENIKTGFIENTADNVWKLRRALDDILTKGDFKSVAGNIYKQKVKQASNMLREELSAVDESIAPLMDAYSKMTEGLNRVRKLVVDADGDIVIKKISRLMSKTGEPFKQDKVRRFMETIPQGRQLLQSIDILNKKNAVKRVGSLITKATVGSAILSQFIKPVKRAADDMTGQGASGAVNTN